MKTLYASRITLLMDVLVEAVHKLVNYAFLCESFCALSPSRDRSGCVLNNSYLFENVYDGRSQIEWASHYYSKENSLSKDLISWPGRAYCSSMVSTTEIGCWMPGPNCVYKQQSAVTQSFL